LTPSLLVSQASSGSYRLSLKKQTSSSGWLVWAVLTGWSIRLLVVALVYRGFLDPGRGYWEFGYEIGRVARSIVLGRGFSDPYWANTGPTALLTPVYPYLLAGVFALFGVYTKVAALVFLAMNTFFSAVTSVPIFLMARRTFDLRTAKIAAWAWVFFPNAINFSATTMWYHSFVALLLAVICLLVLSLEFSDRLMAWAGLGALLGFAALTNPVVAGIVPALGGWLWVQRTNHRTRALATGVALIAMAATIMPWVVRNERVLHHPVVFKDGFWLEVCVGNVNSSLHWWDADQHPSGSARESAQYERMGEWSYMAAKRRQAFAYIAAHPRAYAFRSLRHAVFMWTGFWSFNPEYLRQEPFDPENICFLSSLSLLSIAGLYRMFCAEKRRTAMLYLLVLLSYPLPYYLSHLDPGFRHPVDPLLLILACSAITRFLPQARVPTRAREEMAELALR
jgi:4-amino-4-deoxy-L-arabinose transferase-like glycosyltransferase